MKKTLFLVAGLATFLLPLAAQASFDSKENCIGHNWDIVDVDGVEPPTLTITAPSTLQEGQSISLTAEWSVHSQQTPYFYWCASSGTLSAPGAPDDFSVVEFTAPQVPPEGKSIKLTTYMGDGSGWMSTEVMEIEVIDTGNVKPEDPSPSVSLQHDGFADFNSTFRFNFQLEDFDENGMESTSALNVDISVSYDGGDYRYVYKGLTGDCDRFNWTPEWWSPTDSPEFFNVKLEASDGNTQTVAISDPVFLEESGVIFGSVADAGGRGISGVTIDITGSNESLKEISDSNGFYRFFGLAQGEYIVTPSLSDFFFQPAAATISIDSPTVSKRADFLAIRIQNPGPGGAIDIKPGSQVNPINPRSRGKIPVAILSSATFDATTELNRFTFTFGRTGDENSLHFRGNGQPNCGEEDVNEDGFVDLVCHFFTQIAGFQEGDTKGFLKGQTISGETFEAMDGINLVPPGHDSDSDGIEDDVEDEGPNNGDANSDGRFDAFQPNVATLNSAVGAGDFITLEVSPSCVISQVQPFDQQSLSPDPMSLPAPQGFIAFTLDSCSLSDTTVFFHGESSFTGAQYRRLGPTPSNRTDHWYTFTDATFATAEIDGTTVATVHFQLRDGELGDDDLTVNGRIVDPGGPVRGAVGTTDIPTLNEIGLGVFILLLLGMGVLIVTRQRRYEA